MSPVPGTALLERLRCETADAHVRLEAGLDLTGDSIDHARYLALLTAFHGFLKPWEAALHAALPPEQRAFFRDRQHAVRAFDDLAAIASLTRTSANPPADDAEALRALPLAAPAVLPVLDSEAAAWGSAYVIEGSTLGGRFISAAISRRLGYTPTAGASYFAGYGADNGRRWLEFRQVVEERVPVSQHDRAVEAAGHTFASLHRWMVHCAVVT